jgi:hypothetical protein
VSSGVEKQEASLKRYGGEQRQRAGGVAELEVK